MVVEWPFLAQKCVAPEDQGRAEQIFAVLSTARPAEMWAESDKLMLAELARLTVLSDKLGAEIEAGGGTQISNSGFESPRPIVSLLNQYNAQRVRLIEKLGVLQTTHNAATVGNRIVANRAAEATADKAAQAKGLLA